MKNKKNFSFPATQNSLYQSIQDFYALIETRTSLKNFRDLKKLADRKNLFLEFLETNILSQKEKETMKKLFQNLTEEFLCDLISVEEAFDQLQKLLLSLEENEPQIENFRQSPTLCHLLHLSRREKLLEQRISSIKGLLTQETLSPFSPSLVKNLDRIRNIFDQNVSSPQELLMQLDTTLRPFKSA